ncbi:MAG: iron-sulfur cluster assembly scaffold protein [candidate division Zixibacteria bacterium]|jgi:nitrogen fixation NifU-like protein|nr:iron-sulfur cluster assembly scaffold protein [candidate division Zixibacteria bacterium]
MYNDTIMEHFHNPRNVGEFEDADAVGQAGNAATGDVMRIYLKVAEGRIVGCRHKTFGNAVAIAVSSMASLMIEGKTLAEAEQITKEDVSEALDGIPPDKMSCSNMAPDAIKAAVADYRKKHQ